MDGIKICDGKIGYRHIPKVACTSLKHALYSVDTGRKFSPNDVQGMDVHQYFNRKISDISECGFKFLVVRDPIKRFLSAYSNRVTLHRELSEKYITWRHPELINEIPFFDPSLSQFIENLEIYLKVDSIAHHVRPVSDIISGRDLDFFDRVYRIEDVKQLKSDLEGISGSVVNIPHDQSGGVKFSPLDLSDEHFSKLLNFYAEDYRLLQSYYDPSNLERRSVKKAENMAAPAPFIIWTLRRTGGTNIGHALFGASNFDSVKHEPFNGDRIFGYILKAWRETGDRAALYSMVDEVLAQKKLIKHCIEIIPRELNNAILELSLKHGYRHIFLYREESTDRLLSLNFALKTGIWGRQQAKSVSLDESVFEQDIDVDALIGHEKKCRADLKWAYENLCDRGQEPSVLTFEGLYRSTSFEYSCELVKRVFEVLNLGSSGLNAEFFQRVLKRGGQGTKEDYVRFGRSQELVDRSRSLGRFSLLKTPAITVDSDSPQDFAVIEAWAPLKGICNGECYVSGVALPKTPAQVSFRDSDGFELGFKMLPSPRMQEQYPDNAGAAKCRFLLGPCRLDMKVHVSVQ